MAEPTVKTNSALPPPLQHDTLQQKRYKIIEDLYQNHLTAMDQATHYLGTVREQAERDLCGIQQLWPISQNQDSIRLPIQQNLERYKSNLQTVENTQKVAAALAIQIQVSLDSQLDAEQVKTLSLWQELIQADIAYFQQREYVAKRHVVNLEQHMQTLPTPSTSIQQATTTPKTDPLNPFDALVSEQVSIHCTQLNNAINTMGHAREAALRQMHIAPIQWKHSSPDDKNQLLLQYQRADQHNNDMLNAIRTIYDTSQSILKQLEASIKTNSSQQLQLKEQEARIKADRQYFINRESAITRDFTQFARLVAQYNAERNPAPSSETILTSAFNWFSLWYNGDKTTKPPLTAASSDNSQSAQPQEQKSTASSELKPRSLIPSAPASSAPASSANSQSSKPLPLPKPQEQKPPLAIPKPVASSLLQPRTLLPSSSTSVKPFMNPKQKNGTSG